MHRASEAKQTKSVPTGQRRTVSGRVLWRHPNSSRTEQRSVARQGLRLQAPCGRALSGCPREVIARSPDRPIARSCFDAARSQHTCAARVPSALVGSACPSSRPHACMAPHG